MAMSTQSDLNSLFSDIFEDARFVARENNIMTSLVRNFQATGWMSRKLSAYPELTAQEVAEGVDYSNPATFNKTLEATLTPAEQMVQVILTDRRIDTDPQNARQDASMEMGNAIATKVDKDLVSDFGSFTTDKGPGAGASATIAKFAAAVSVLRNALAPNPIYVVLHPYHWHAVWVELGQPATNQAFLGDVANEALRSFYVGNWINCQWFVSANIAVDASDDAVSGVFNRNALGFDLRKPFTMEPERDASLRAWELNASIGYAHGVIRDEFGVGYTADAAEPT
jgi:hypothetical protein